ncbi:MAG: ABC transporter ATP-binding protein [SAR202 cluster bacterium]|nr:ABC transporter ATP-binding protein [SAR202 cluster bacterium]
MPENIVESHDVHKTYESNGLAVHALRGIDLAILKGQMVAIMGPSGCGKTTLLNTFSGIDDITRGEVIIEGQSIHRLSDRQRTRYRARRMGFVFQSYNLLPVLTAVENIELPLLVAGVEPKAARARALEVLRQVGLPDQANKRPGQMSGGQQQRVTIARALANQPAIVWADELTGALDSETSGEIMDLVVRLNKEEGQTFVIVTHDANVAKRADRIVHMRDGLIETDTRAAAGV